MVMSCIFCKRKSGGACASLHLFSIPSNPERREIWRKVHKDPNFEMKRYHRICEEHFHPDDIERESIIDYGEMGMVSIKRQKVRLKKTAVPTFTKRIISSSDELPSSKKQNLATDANKNAAKNTYTTPTAEGNHISSESAPIYKLMNIRNTNANNISVLNSNNKTIMPIVPSRKSFDFSNAVQPFFFDLQNISMPSDLWTCGKAGNRIIFAKWDSDYKSLVLHVNVFYSLKFQVIVNAITINLSNEHFPSVINLENIQDVLQKIDKLEPCAGLKTDNDLNPKARSTKCIGFVTVSSTGRRSLRCMQCTEESRKRLDREKRRFVKEAGICRKRIFSILG